MRLLYPKTNASVEAVIRSVVSRTSLGEWARSPAAQAAGVEVRRLRSMEWWRELPKYKFILSPIGAAVQTAKNIEALLVLTIPVVHPMGFPAYRELVGLGFPLVLIQSWSEVTPNSTEKWWRRMSPRLESFRRNCLTVDAYWRMYIGDIRRCE